MDKNMLKLFLGLFLATSFLFISMNYGVKAYERVTADPVYANGTKIVSIDISGLTKQQAIQKASDSVNKWKEEVAIIMQYKKKEVTISGDIFHFQLTDTFASIKNGTTNPFVVSVDQDVLTHELNQFSSLAVDRVELTSLVDYLHTPATELITIPPLSIEDFLMASDKQTDVMNTVTTILGDKKEAMEQLVTTIQEIEVLPNTSFSLMELLNDYELQNASDEMLSILATAFYQTILPTNFEILERHVSRELPAYAILGYEARINKKEKMDLRFKNVNEQAYQIEIKMEEDQLVTKLKGQGFQHKYQIAMENKQDFSPRTIIQFDPLLKYGEKKDKQKGKNGQSIEVYREKLDANGLVVEKKKVSEDYYAPLFHIEVHSLEKKDPILEDGNEETLDKDDEEAIETERSTDTEVVDGDFVESDNDLEIIEK